MSRHFMELLHAKLAEGKRVCVGLDPVLEKIPQPHHATSTTETLVHFLFPIIDATKHIAAAIKPNFAFYAAYGPAGCAALDAIGNRILTTTDVPYILDDKRGDIGKSNEGYVKEAFSVYQADAMTLHPYLGAEALQPFLKRSEKGFFVLDRTSNPGAGEFQDLFTLTQDPRARPEGMSAEEWLEMLCDDTMQLYERVAHNIATAERWNKHGNCGVVAGGTYPQEVGIIRKLGPELMILVPGFGAQGGTPAQVVPFARNSQGSGYLGNSSSGITHAHLLEQYHGEHFAEAAALAAEAFHNEIKAAEALASQYLA